MELPQARHTERNMDIAVVRQHQAMSHPDGPGDDRGSAESAARSSGDVAIGIHTAPDHRRSYVHKVAFREMTGERSDNDSGDDEQRSQVTLRSSMATFTIPRTLAHETQIRHSPSFSPDNTQVCVRTDVNRPKEKDQPVMEGT